ncbi:hypothetical protein FA15DRAFT_629996 [Coprinopsis marcescibilis]|uniref:F-box domain-containing protein n=1 Tax=Coprinopsis marcescibilis TaxID=230819 RepID=A0A5C3LD90_COPMA|nr:hypothetical protein FA15DRAFT_629996 [Coprinopsis marcescibilis]
MAQVDQLQLIEDIFNCPPIYNAIFSCLGPLEITRARRVCRLLRDAIVHFQALAYDINRHLSAFFHDPIALRRLQAKTKFLISGSSTLQFLDRIFYPFSDMDIFAFPDTIKEIGKHLIESEDYAFLPGENQPKSFDETAVQPLDTSETRRVASQNSFVYSSGMSGLFRFKRKSTDLEVQVICASRSPFDCILYFHSTCVMNFMTHAAAYSLYPIATFDKRISIPFGSEHFESTGKAYKKYTERGYTVPNNLTYSAAKIMNPFLHYEIPRSLNDRYTWRIPLNVEELDLGKESIYDTTESGNPFQCNSWTLELEFRSYSKVIAFGLSYLIFRSPYFENSYTIPDVEFREVLAQTVDYAENVEEPLIEDGDRVCLDPLLPRLLECHKIIPKRLYDRL